MAIDTLKKPLRAIDLALSAGRKRQSPRTGFVHLFPGDETASDVVPFYENFCFALALFRHKTAESVNEGKELIERLLAFQMGDGNFPVFLHDYPRCYDFQMGLKIGPVLLLILRHFPSILGDVGPKIESALKKILATRPEKTVWENRFRALVGEPLMPVDTTDFSLNDWIQWLITAQLAGQTHFAIPYNEALQVFLGPTEIQEKGEPQPNVIEWLLAEGNYSPRLAKDHSHQLLCAPLFPLSSSASSEARALLINRSYRLLWKGTTLHSFALFHGSQMAPDEVIFDLLEGVEMGRNDLFEATAFVDISPETEIFVGEGKATLFKLGETVTVKTPQLTINLTFELISGEGDFCGHIFRANRPTQIACKGPLLYEAYDWQIGVRTLRRSGPCQIRLRLDY